MREYHQEPGCVDVSDVSLSCREEQVAYRSDKAKHNVAPFDIEPEGSSEAGPHSSRQDDSPV